MEDALPVAQRSTGFDISEQIQQPQHQKNRHEGAERCCIVQSDNNPDEQSA
jgi:hypothetical protein